MSVYHVKCTVFKTIDKTSAMLLGIEKLSNEYHLEFVVNHSDDDYEKELIDVKDLIIAEYFSEWNLKNDMKDLSYVSIDGFNIVRFNVVEKLPMGVLLNKTTLIHY